MKECEKEREGERVKIGRFKKPDLPRYKRKTARLNADDKCTHKRKNEKRRERGSKVNAITRRRVATT